jgi:hypothetical protein
VSDRPSTVVCVSTSERTWHALERFCFNSVFRVQRQRFVLAVGFNGHDADGLRYLESIHPEHLFVRPNTGHDLANFDNVLKRLPSFDRYILLHDDHWFYDPLWFDVLTELQAGHREIDIWGNLVGHDVTGEFLGYYSTIARALGYDELVDRVFPHFLQGLAGVFSRRAIDIVLAMDGIPHLHRSIQTAAQVCERLFSGLLLDRGLRFGQIPPGYELYLMHRDHSIVKTKLEEAAGLMNAGDQSSAEEIFALLRKLRPGDDALEARIGYLRKR